jgi:hypothetical protein
VRGRVLQQRRPPPALRRLAEALLPVQPPPLLEQSFGLESSTILCGWLRGGGGGGRLSDMPRTTRMKKADFGVFRLQQSVF